MFEKFFRIIGKNFRILWRSRSSIFIVLFVPVLAVILLGMAFNNLKSEGITTGIYVKEGTDITNSIINRLDEKFEVIKFDSEADCINSVLNGKTQVCAVFDKLIVEESKENKIIFHVDYSKINLVWMIIDVASSTVYEKSEEISFDLTTILINKLKQTQSVIKNQSAVVEDLRKSNNDMEEVINKVYADLSGLDLEIDLEDMHIINLEERIDKVEEGMDSIRKQIQKATAAFEDVKDAIDDLNLNSNESQEITSLLDGLESDLNNLSKKVNASNAVLTNISSLINKIETKIEEVKIKFENVEKVKEDTIDSLDIVKDILTKSKADLDALQNSLSGINENIASIKITNASNIITPINTIIEPIIPEKTYLNYIFPTLIAMVVMFTSVLFSSTAIVFEKNSKAFFRNFITPTSEWIFIAARYTTDILVIGVQVFLFIAISAYFLNVQIIQGIWLSLLALFLISSLFILLGMTVGYIFNLQQISALAAISLSSIMLFLSNTIIPIESMSSAIRMIAKFNPFVIAEGMLRKTIVYNLGLGSIASDIYLMIGYSAVILVIIAVIVRLTKKEFLKK